MQNIIFLLIATLLAGPFDPPIDNRPQPKKEQPTVEEAVELLVYLINFQHRCENDFYINKKNLKAVAGKLNEAAKPNEDMIQKQYVEEIKFQNQFMEEHHIGPQQWCLLQKFVLKAHGFENFFEQDDGKEL